MKLRIKGNTLRFRLSQGEVEQLSLNGNVVDSVDFGVAVFKYRIESGDYVKAAYKNEEVCVTIPKSEMSTWANSDKITLSYVFEKLSLLIEKDFACLKVRKGEDESDLFENPDAVDFKC